jgi:hypothetical protein
VVFLAGPLLFLYIGFLTSQKTRLDKKDLLHFLPFLFCFIYLLPYYLQSSAAKMQVLSAECRSVLSLSGEKPSDQKRPVVRQKAGENDSFA